MKKKIDEIDITLTQIDGKTYDELSWRWKKTINVMFKEMTEDVVHALKVPGKKNIIDITYHGKTKRVICYYGNRAVIFRDNVYEFLNYLEILGVSKRTISIIMFFHFGKSKKISDNGKAFNKEKIVNIYGLYLKEANEELNDSYILKKLMNRYIACLSDENVDYFYLMDVKNELFLPYNQLVNYFNKFYMDDVGPIHIGTLVYEPESRNSDSKKNIYYHLKWSSGMKKIK